METAIHIEFKNNYGNELIYITNEPFKSAVARLTGKKTISKSDVAALKALGFTVSQPALVQMGKQL